MRAIASLAALLHDCGKYSDEFQEYMRWILEYGSANRHSKVDHSTAGGLLMETFAPDTLLAKMVKTAVFLHHGLQDCIRIEYDKDHGKSLTEIREAKNLDLELTYERYLSEISEELLRELCGQAKEQVNELKLGIQEAVKRGGKTHVYGSRDFFLGMYERLLISILIDSDWTDSASFQNDPAADGKAESHVQNETDTEALWEICILNFERYMKELSEKKKQNSDKRSEINRYRQIISDACSLAAMQGYHLYRLTVPTGAGKTLSALRFALFHAIEKKKQRIFYTAPYNSILEQNAAVIRDAVGNPDLVLEHHCNVVQENKEEEERYKRLAETWDAPIILTSAVQMLNTLFSGKKMNIRRMYRLCNSIIIFDEVQALPVRCTELFNLAVNFLTAFCNTTIVLCSATQPSLVPLPCNRVFEAEEMAGDLTQYQDAFRRTTILDKTELKSGGLAAEDMIEFLSELLPRQRTILVIVNTKACALNIYEGLKERYGESSRLFHLSTNMCPVNRKSVLDQIKGALDSEGSEPVICISTQLVEAGVDFSFQCVIRSMAGLDSIVQAAGRCNRNQEYENGFVYVVKMSEEAENLSRLQEIRDAQTAMEEVLYQFKEAPETLKSDLNSREAIAFYYNRYFYKKSGSETAFPVLAGNMSTTIVKLLSDNAEICRQTVPKPGKLLNQSFRTAGEKFEVIAEDGKVEVIAAYDKESKELVAELDDPYLGLEEKRRKLRRLQGYTVEISVQLRNRLGNAIWTGCNGTILVLNEGYYSEETGVREWPMMPNLMT